MKLWRLPDRGGRLSDAQEQRISLGERSNPSSFILDLGLSPEFAKIADQAGRAGGVTRGAHVTSVQDQPMVGILAEVLWDEFHQLVLDFDDVLPGGDAGPVGDPEDMGVPRYGRFADRGIE